MIIHVPEAHFYINIPNILEMIQIKIYRRSSDNRSLSKMLVKIIYEFSNMLQYFFSRGHRSRFEYSVWEVVTHSLLLGCI